MEHLRGLVKESKKTEKHEIYSKGEGNVTNNAAAAPAPAAASAAAPAAKAKARPDQPKWTCGVCNQTIFLKNKAKHLTSHTHVENEARLGGTGGG
jgi:3-oxoacyl-ACP reductase-like protein